MARRAAQGMLKAICSAVPAKPYTQNPSPFNARGFNEIRRLDDWNSKRRPRAAAQHRIVQQSAAMRAETDACGER